MSEATNEMPTVILSAEDRDLAMSRARARLRSGLYNRMDQDDTERLRRASDGALGEIAFERVLERSGVPFIAMLDGTGPDKADFYLPTAVPATQADQRRVAEPVAQYEAIATKRSVDVKIAITAKEPRPSWSFGFPVDQHPERKDLLVLGYVDPQRTTVRFWGCLRGSVLIGRPPNSDNAFAGFSYQTTNVEARLEEFDRSFSAIGKLK